MHFLFSGKRSNASENILYVFIFLFLIKHCIPFGKIIYFGNFASSSIAQKIKITYLSPFSVRLHDGSLFKKILGQKYHYVIISKKDTFLGMCASHHFRPTSEKGGGGHKIVIFGCVCVSHLGFF